MAIEVVTEDEKKKGSPVPYVLLIFLAVAWLWNVKIVGFKANASEAIGFDIGSTALPLLLLWFAVKRFVQNVGSGSPGKLATGFITSACALMALIDLLNSAAPHRLGALIFVALFGSASAMLFKQARKNAEKSQPTPATAQS